MESRTEDLAARLLRCPVGCAFLLTIVRDEVPIELAVTPPQAFARAAVALDVLNPWSGDLERTVTAALSRGADLASLAHAVVSHPQSRWWTAPMDPPRQAFLRDDTPRPVASRAAPPRNILARILRLFERPSSRPAAPASNIRWEAYAQRPKGWRITSTLKGENSCLDTAIALGVGEWGAETRRRFAAEIDESVRVFEVSSPADWHSLCVSFPSVNQDPNSPAGADSLSPDWCRVATEWDGVHLTFMGLLTAPFVRHNSAGGTTMLWSWDTEGTFWLSGDFLRAGAPLAQLDRDAHAFEIVESLMDDELGIPEWPPVPGVIHYRYRG